MFVITLKDMVALSFLVGGTLLILSFLAYNKASNEYLKLKRKFKR